MLGTSEGRRLLPRCVLLGSTAICTLASLRPTVPVLYGVVGILYLLYTVLVITLACVTVLHSCVREPSSRVFLADRSESPRVHVRTTRYTLPTYLPTSLPVTTLYRTHTAQPRSSFVLQYPVLDSKAHHAGSLRDVSHAHDSIASFALTRACLQVLLPRESHSHAQADQVLSHIHTHS